MGGRWLPLWVHLITYICVFNTKPLQAISWALLLVICSCTHDPLFDPVEAPSHLSYLPDSLAVQSGQTGNSSTPTLSGSGPFTFNLNTIPGNGGSITVDEEGVIRVSSQAVPGKYSASVVVINGAGSVSFSDIYKIRVYAPAIPPSGLVYTPDTVSILVGNGLTSAKPVVTGTRPFTFTIIDNPAPDQISINNDGVVSATSDLPAGYYTLTIQVENAVGSETFSEVLVLHVTTDDAFPSELTYSVNAIVIDSGTVATSVAPSISGTAPFTFALTSSPDAGTAITIDGDGRITASGLLAPGVYIIDVHVTNSAGMTDFSDVFTITVNELKKITFTNDVLPLINVYCSTCHTTGPHTLYTDYNNAARDINLILDRVQRKPGTGGFMPKNNPPLTPEQIQVLKDWLAQGLIE